MLRKLLGLLLLSLCGATGYAQPESNKHHFMDVALDPAQVAVGQKITLSVVIGVDSYFSGVTELALPDMEHALVLHDEPAINGAKSIDDTYFTTQTHRINVYPDREGILVVPSFRVTFTQAVVDSDALRSESVQLPTPPMLVIVSEPASMRDTPGFMVSDAVEITDEWDREGQAEFQVGDVLTRVISITAAGMAAMNMPQFVPQVPRGMSVMLAEPALSSSSGRDEVGATLVQHISYAVEAPGHYELGGETLAWFDPSDASRREHVFAVNTVNAGGLPWAVIAVLMIALLLVALVAVLWRRHLRRRDQIEIAIKARLGSSQSAGRLAAVYAYADYHQPQEQAPARLRTLLAASGALVEKALAAQFSRQTVPDCPTRRESRTLYRQLRKKQRPQ